VKKADVELRSQLVLTKGDNNVVDDVGMYPDGREWVHREEVVGLVKCYIPMIGRISLFMKDHLEASYVVLIATLVIGILL
jgi:signal peptidase